MNRSMRKLACLKIIGLLGILSAGPAYGKISWWKCSVESVRNLSVNVVSVHLRDCWEGDSLAHATARAVIRFSPQLGSAYGIYALAQKQTLELALVQKKRVDLTVSDDDNSYVIDASAVIADDEHKAKGQ